MPNQPLAEVFGFPIDNMTEEAERHRTNRLCPFGNSVPNCTKTSIENPLGVCSVLGTGGEAVITCPVRFQEGWRIASDAAGFFFPPGAAWTSLTEVRLKDSAGKSAGNIDVVLLSYDALGRIVDYGALEVQVSFPGGSAFADSILNDSGRKRAVAMNTQAYGTLPPLDEVEPADANLAFFGYDLVRDTSSSRYVLTLNKTIYARQEAGSTETGGEKAAFTRQLEKRLGIVPAK
jgi:hypothetical protein